MSAYAAAVQQQRQLERERPAGAAGGQQGGEEGSSSAWRDILRLDPVAQKLRRSKLARIAFRRWVGMGCLGGYGHGMAWQGMACDLVGGHSMARHGMRFGRWA